MGGQPHQEPQRDLEANRGIGNKLVEVEAVVEEAAEVSMGIRQPRPQAQPPIQLYEGQRKTKAKKVHLIRTLKKPIRDWIVS